MDPALRRLLLVGIPTGVVAAVVAGIAYQAAMIHLPLKRAIIGGPLLAGALVGGVVALASRFGHYSDRLPLSVLGIHLGMAAWGASWWCAVDHAQTHGLQWIESDAEIWDRRLEAHSDLRPFDPERRTEAADVENLTDYLQFRFKYAWPERDERHAAGQVAVVYFIELVLVCGIAAFGACVWACAVPLCPEHRRWSVVAEEFTVPESDASLLRGAGEKEDLATVLACPRQLNSRYEARFRVYQCPACDRRHVTVTLHWTKPGIVRPKRCQEEVFGRPLPMTGDEYASLCQAAIACYDTLPPMA